MIDVCELHVFGAEMSGFKEAPLSSATLPAKEPSGSPLRQAFMRAGRHKCPHCKHAHAQALRRRPHGARRVAAAAACSQFVLLLLIASDLGEACGAKANPEVKSPLYDSVSLCHCPTSRPCISQTGIHFTIESSFRESQSPGLRAAPCWRVFGLRGKLFDYKLTIPQCTSVPFLRPTSEVRSGIVGA